MLKRGYLTKKSITEEREYVNELAHKINNLKKKIGFLFLITYDCNFRCKYCYEGLISQNGQGWKKSTMSVDMINYAYQAIQDISPIKKDQIKTIGLYGVEPLLAENFKVVSYIIKKGLEKGYSFSAITNGFDIDVYKEFLNSTVFKNLQITLDGTQDIHDKIRIHKNGEKTFDKIIKNIKIALDNGIKISVRINTSENNFNQITPLYDFFHKEGWFTYTNFYAYTAPIIDCSSSLIKFKNKFDNSSQSDVFFNRGTHASKYYDEIAKNPLLANISCHDLGLRKRIRKAIIEGGSVSLKTSFCGANTGSYIFDPLGDVYTCWEIVGQEKYKIGTYKEKLTIDKEKLINWTNRNIMSIPECSKCKYAFFCGGGCVVRALYNNKDFNSSYCDSFPVLFRNIVIELLNERMKNNGKKCNKISNIVL